jgi:hypothetical protein
MAHLSTSPRPRSARHSSRRLRPSMSSKQLQAYFLAREVLRRLKPAPTPCVPPDLQLRKSTLGGS